MTLADSGAAVRRDSQEGFASPGLGAASLQGLGQAGMGQVRRKGVSSLLGTTMFLLPSQLPAWEGVCAATVHGCLVEGSRLRTVPFYSPLAGRRGAQAGLVWGRGGHWGVCEGQLPPQLPISCCSPQAGAGLLLPTEPLSQDGWTIVTLASAVTWSWAGGR